MVMCHAVSVVRERGIKMNDKLKIELKVRDIYGFEKDIIRDNSDVFLKVDRVYKDENNKYIAEYDVAGFKSLTKIKRLNLAGYLKIEKAISELFLKVNSQFLDIQQMRICADVIFIKPSDFEARIAFVPQEEADIKRSFAELSHDLLNKTTI